MRKKLLSVLLVLSVLQSLVCTSVWADTGTELSVSTNIENEEICSVDANGERYLFLPANADITNLSLRFTSNGADVDHVTLSGEWGEVSADEPFDLTSIAWKMKDGSYVMSVVTEDGQRTRLHVMQGTGLPALYLHSDDASMGRSWVDSSKKNQATGSMELVDIEGEQVYSGGLTQIKARGNSTFTYSPKKSYQIKLEKKTDLLGNGEKVKTWVLLANYADATLMHDKLVKDMAAQLGMKYVVSCSWVNLYYDGEYRGVYLLGEKNSVGDTGVDITDMEDLYGELNSDYGEDMKIAEALNRFGGKYLYAEGLTEPEELTGGYLIEKNHDYIDEACGFITSRNAGVNVKSPEYAGQEAMKYISEYYQAFEDAVYAVDENGTYTGYNQETEKYFYEYVDMESLIQSFLLWKFASNPDGFVSSMYFHKDANGIMYMGPVWDQDITMGTGWSEYIGPEWIYYRYLSEALIRIPAFREALEEYFADVFVPMMERFLAEGGEIDQYKQMLTDSAAMNYKLWPYVRIGDPAHEDHLWSEGTGYGRVTRDMTNWMEERMDVLQRMFTPVEAQSFADVSADSWAFEAVSFAADRGIISGVSEQSFAPADAATRGMTFTALARMDGQPKTSELEWVTEQGISDGSAPEAPITREQLARMLYLYAGTPETQGDLSRFSDGADVSSWAKEAMSWAVSEGIFSGYTNGRLNPGKTASRAELAQVMMNFMTEN